MSTFLFDTTMFPRVTREYPEIFQPDGSAHRFQCLPAQYDSLPASSGLRQVFSVVKEEIPLESYEYLLAIIDRQAGKPENETNARLAGYCTIHGFVLVTGDRTLAEAAWKYGVPVQSLREFLKAVGCPRYADLEP